MGSSESAETQRGQLAARSFEVLRQDVDQRFGDCRLVRFEDDPGQLYLHKTMQRLDPRDPDEATLAAKAMKPFPHVSPVVHFEPSEEGGHLDVLCRFSLHSLERLLGARPLLEAEVWQVYDFLVDAGLDFERCNEHFFEICSRDILYFGDAPKVCSQYLYEKYALSALKHFSRSPLPPEEKKVLVRVWRHNVKRLGIFLIEACLRRVTKIDAKNSLMIEQEAERMKQFYSRRLCKFVANLAFNREGFVFSALKKSAEISLPEDLPRRLPAEPPEPSQPKQLRLISPSENKDKPKPELQAASSSPNPKPSSFINANPKPFDSAATAPSERIRTRHESYSERKLLPDRLEDFVRRPASERPTVREAYSEHLDRSPKPAQPQLKANSLPTDLQLDATHTNRQLAVDLGGRKTVVG